MPVGVLKDDYSSGLEVKRGLSISICGLTSTQERKRAMGVYPVSYTHLTLPTKRIV